MATVYFTIPSTTHIPIQISKWLAVCETAQSPRCSHGHCMPTDIQVLSNEVVRVLCVVDERDVGVVTSIPDWAKLYSEEVAREAHCSIPLPSWVLMEHPIKGPPVSNLTCAKYLAEILMALYRLFQKMLCDTDSEGPHLHKDTLRECLLYIQNTVATGLADCVMAEPLNEERLDSILNLADYWCVRLQAHTWGQPSPFWLMPPMAPLPPLPPLPLMPPLPPENPPPSTAVECVKGSKEYRLRKRTERQEAERAYWEAEGRAEKERIAERAQADPELPELPGLSSEMWKKGDFPKLGPSPHGSPLSVAGRVAYAASNHTVVPGVMPGQVALCIPASPKIITEDLMKLCKVAYLGLPEYNEKLWFKGKSQFDIRTNMHALAT